jgi:hypothetical protein
MEINIKTNTFSIRRFIVISLFLFLHCLAIFTSYLVIVTVLRKQAFSILASVIFLKNMDYYSTCFSWPVWYLAFLLANNLSCANAHEHMEMTPVQWSETELQPIDIWLKLHIILMLMTFGGLFPLGIIFGMTKHRFHVPTQIIAIILTTLGIILGYAHGGRVFPHSAHSTGANWVILMIIIQASIGVFLKFYRQPTILRLVTKTGHKVIGIGWFVMGGVQCALGLITYMGYCGDMHTGNCLAHGLMGSSIAVYGIGAYITSSGAGRHWLHRLANRLIDRINKSRRSSSSLSYKGQSVDWVDAWLITVWGVFNTFTEHHWGQVSN